MQTDIPTGIFYGLLAIFGAWILVLYIIFFVFNVDSKKDSSSEHEEAGAE